ncbi:hypothetical protein SAMN05660489_04525 [Pseudomonas sp. LAMO17WK12:I10]|uniref:hypothetical protein n=1 Tax=unclassified Pseudomonas TaxID=196821 RepID=UPI000BCAF0D2|nr:MULTISPECIES: hypothetical protein [unclassified Pseudomonas]PXX59500.1 hypothetical protein H160_04620 [Pseudomonas sp. LAMO17WK12:I9]SNY46606.1 hypothetical protein SAMN05660489_04525 [Pseudomonas sp. LAMO17WK12:I10]
MSIDRAKLKSLLWSVVASWKAGDGDLQRHTTALDEILGDKTVEEVALLLIEENERLRADLDGEISQARDFNIEHEELKSERDHLKAKNEALRKERDKLAEDKQGLLEDFAGCL